MNYNILDEISRDDLRAAIDAESVTIVDARAEIAWASEHLPGALNLPYILTKESLSEKAAEVLPGHDASIAVYCTNAACHASGDVGHQLLRLGYTRVRKYREGIEDWVAAGLPTESA